jgi:hypothetical protein
MAAAVRYTWLFRTAAVVYLLFGVLWIADATLTDRFAAGRPYLLGAGIAATIVGIFLFTRRKFAVAISGVGAAVVAISAIFFATLAKGPGVLALGLLAVGAGLYAAIAARVLFGHKGE